MPMTTNAAARPPAAEREGEGEGEGEGEREEGGGAPSCQEIARPRNAPRL